MPAESNEIKIAVLQNQMNNVEKKVDELDKKIETGFERIEKSLKEALEGKADIWVEVGLKWFLYILVGAIILAVLSIIGLKAQLI